VCLTDKTIITVSFNSLFASSIFSVFFSRFISNNNINITLESSQPTNKSNESSGQIPGRMSSSLYHWKWVYLSICSVPTNVQTRATQLCPLSLGSQDLPRRDWYLLNSFSTASLWQWRDFGSLSRVGMQ
jgi:hypothetical protein